MIYNRKTICETLRLQLGHPVAMEHQMGLQISDTTMKRLGPLKQGPTGIHLPDYCKG